MTKKTIFSLRFFSKSGPVDRATSSANPTDVRSGQNAICAFRSGSYRASHTLSRQPERPRILANPLASDSASPRRVSPAPSAPPPHIPPPPTAAAPPSDPAVAAPGPTLPCSACGVSVAHLSCIAAPDHHRPSFVCPPCAAAAEGRDFSFAPAPGRRPLEERDARVLLVAARLSHDSISRAAATARAEAERRVAEARKRSRKMLDAAFRALEAEARDAKMNRAAAHAQAQPPPPPKIKTEAAQPPPPLPKKKPKAAQPPPPPPHPKKKPEANRDKLLKLNAMQQPALAFAAAAAAATSAPLPTPSYREEKKPVVKQEAQGSAPPPRENQDRPPLLGTLQS